MPFQSGRFQDDENRDLVEVVKGILDQFRETLPLLDLNLNSS
jgi:hypothetical protein